MDGSTGNHLASMYREKHLQKKSDECAKIWYEWFALFEKKDPSAPEVRKKWCKCCTEFGELITKEVRENPRYSELTPKTIRGRE